MGAPLACAEGWKVVKSEVRSVKYEVFMETGIFDLISGGMLGRRYVTVRDSVPEMPLLNLRCASCRLWRPVNVGLAELVAKMIAELDDDSLMRVIHLLQEEHCRRHNLPIPLGTDGKMGRPVTWEHTAPSWKNQKGEQDEREYR